MTSSQTSAEDKIMLQNNNNVRKTMLIENAMTLLAMVIIMGFLSVSDKDISPLWGLLLMFNLSHVTSKKVKSDGK